MRFQCQFVTSIVYNSHIYTIDVKLKKNITIIFEIRCILYKIDDVTCLYKMIFQKII